MVVTEEVLCELCGSAQRTLLYWGEDRLLKHPGRFPLVRCDVCGLVYQSPRPIDIAPYYEGTYVSFDSQPSAWKPLLRRHAEQHTVFYGSAGLYYGVLRKVIPWRSGRLLDVGCATGDLLVAMDSFGWEVYGVEPSAAAAERANRRLGHHQRPPVTIGALEDAGYPDDFFDVVTLWHVIEHLPHPLATMREVRRVLKPGGICVIQTPCRGSLESLLFGRYWSGLDCPRHFWIFSHLTLQALVEQAGLPIWQRPVSTSYGMFAISGMFWADATFGRGTGQRLFQWLHTPIVERLFSPFFALLDRSGLGSQLTVVVVKPMPKP